MQKQAVLLGGFMKGKTMTGREKLIELLGEDTCHRDGCYDCDYDGDRNACIEYLKNSMADFLLANGATFATDNNDGCKWIPVTERLPEEKTYVLISCGGNVHVARIEMGIDEQMRDAMKRGELSDPLIPSWSASTGHTWVKRSMLYSSCDVYGNNLAPYCWYSNYGPGKWFGQEVSHWMPLPEPPKEV